MAEELVVPSTGELVNLEDATQVARALRTLRDLERDIRAAKEELTFALAEHAKLLGTRSIALDDGHTATIKGSSETVYDAEAIMTGLRAAGMPESRIAQIIEETVTYKVKAVEAKRAAAANPDYARIIADHSQTYEKRPSVELK